MTSERNLGKSRVQTGLDMHVDNFTPGEPPTSIFMALPVAATNRCHVVFAGLEDAVRRFERRIARMIYSPRLHLRLWTRRMDLPRGSIKLGACCLGSWPEECSDDVVRGINQGGTTSTRQAAKIYVEQFSRDPQREAFDGNDEHAAIWCDLFFEQFVLAYQAGRVQ